MPSHSLGDFPTEIIDAIIKHCYEPWSLSILDRVVKGTLAVDGLPSSKLFSVSKALASIAQRHERLAFSGELVFTTACTQWRVLTRLRTLSPGRVGYFLDRVHTLRFCSPPLFTNRIPWTSLPGLKRVELDYSKRSANFRAQGTLRELEAGYLDTLIVNFARDSERFDGPVVEDAWRASNTPPSPPDPAMKTGTSENNSTSLAELGNGIEVLILKTMNITEMPRFHNSSLTNPLHIPVGGSSTRIMENWKIKVTALHRGQLERVTFSLMAGFHEVPGDLLLQESMVWRREMGFRETLTPEDVYLLRRKLVPSEVGLRFG